MITITKRLEFDAGHRLLNHEGKCKHLHGHRYAAEITCYSMKLDDVGRVIDFSKIKEVVGGWIDSKWDHGVLVNVQDYRLMHFLEVEDSKFYTMPNNPTAENIAAELYRVASHLLESEGIAVIQVVVFETPTCSATCLA